MEKIKNEVNQLNANEGRIQELEYELKEKVEEVFMHLAETVEGLREEVR